MKMSHWMLSTALVALAAAGGAMAATESGVSNFVVAADPVAADAGSLPAAPPSRLGEVVTGGRSGIFRAAALDFGGRRASEGCADIAFALRTDRPGTGEIRFEGRRRPSGIGEVDFSPRAAPGVRGTLRRIGATGLP